MLLVDCIQTPAQGTNVGIAQQSIYNIGATWWVESTKQVEGEILLDWPLQWYIQLVPYLRVLSQEEDDNSKTVCSYVHNWSLLKHNYVVIHNQKATVHYGYGVERSHFQDTSGTHTTGYMPFFLMFGRLQARTQADLIFEPEALSSSPSDCASTPQTTLRPRIRWETRRDISWKSIILMHHYDYTRMD